MAHEGAAELERLGRHGGGGGGGGAVEGVGQARKGREVGAEADDNDATFRKKEEEERG